MKVIFFFFFFSSRRRHTRLTCDWSSDVCSSDLCYGDGRVGLGSLQRHGAEQAAPREQRVLQQRHDGAQVVPQQLRGVGGRGAHGVAALVDELAVEVLDGGSGQLLLGTEVVEEAAFGDAGSGADVVERGRFVAALEQLVSGWSTWSWYAVTIPTSR